MQLGRPDIDGDGGQTLTQVGSGEGQQYHIRRQPASEHYHHRDHNILMPVLSTTCRLQEASLDAMGAVLTTR